ncbi:hypothetical protein HUE87_02700 [Candidatus Sulfurimonas marisnigri]|uniref:Uncharacterized protein n=1 Tax=Candidatus Sulfurimonas marisnigri TaxID=2740405 RepID=A0A7S7RQ79_9BACT|nr:hypothetical protein [Candidatus Sulfurimonas marisnigri]QOY55167.1 hypothetical protein HUE87_02700 [Candidatus Sulfurimonas marisnigri]
MKKKKALTKEEREAKNLTRNLKNMNKNKKKMEEKVAKNKSGNSKEWSKEKYNQYFTESNRLSDYSCPKGGIVKSKYRKK